MNALTLLQAALGLMMALNASTGPIPDDLRAQIISIANQAITEANYEIAQQPMADTSTSTSPTTPPETDTPVVTAPTEDEQVTGAPQAQDTIEIVIIDNTHQLTDTWDVAPANITDPTQATSTDYLAQIGAVLRNPDGSVDQTSTMTVTTDDASQDKTIVGTGTFWGNPNNVFYFPYQYLFKTAGAHTITFSANGVSQSVTLNAQ